MSQKVFIISGLDESTQLSQLKSISINFDSEDNNRLLWFDSNQTKFYEMVKQNNNFRSFLTNDSVISDGNYYVFTPFDVIFIVLPFLMKKRKHFHSVFEILSDIFDKEIVTKVEESLKSEDIEVIADVKYMSEDLFVRYNSSKALQWLRTKTERTVDALIQNNINVSSDGCKVEGYISGKEDQNRDRVEYMRIAFDLISQYLNNEIKEELKNLLRIPNEDSNNSKTGMTGIKRKVNEKQSSSPLEDYSEYKSTSNASSDQKRTKMTRSQKELLKVDITGMKSISSFFKPKPK